MSAVSDGDRQCWQTPLDLYGFLDGCYDFQLDAAALAENAKCRYFITPEEDALSAGQAWVGRGTLGGVVRRVFLNPGFKDVMPWVIKAHEEASKRTDALVGMVGLLSAADWFGFCMDHASEIFILTPRPQFIPPAGVKVSKNAKDNVFIVFRKKLVPAPALITRLRWK